MNYITKSNLLARSLLSMITPDTGLYDIQRALSTVAKSEISKDLRKLIPDLQEVKIEAESESMDDGTSETCISYITLVYGDDERTITLDSTSELESSLQMGGEYDQEQLLALLDQFPLTPFDEGCSPEVIQEARFSRLHGLCCDFTEFTYFRAGETVFVLDDLIYDFNDDSETSDEPTEVTTPA